MIVSYRVNFYWKTGNRNRGYDAGVLVSCKFVERAGRKDYWCVDCGQVIPAGQAHLVDANSTVRLHKHCGIKAEQTVNEVPRHMMEVYE